MVAHVASNETMFESVEVIRHERGNQVRASEVLGIARNTLRAKIRAAGLEVAKHLAPESEQAG